MKHGWSKMILSLFDEKRHRPAVCFFVLFVALSTKLAYSYWSHEFLKNDVTNVKLNGCALLVFSINVCIFWGLFYQIWREYLGQHEADVWVKITTACELMKGHVSSKNVWIIDGLLEYSRAWWHRHMQY